MEGVLEDEDLSFDDALAYTDALLQAETAHKASQAVLSGDSLPTSNFLKEQQYSTVVAASQDGQAEVPLRVREL